MNKTVFTFSWLLGLQLFLLTSTAHSQFECYSGQGICLQFNQKVVDQNAKCFSQYTCGFGGLVCESDYDDCVSKYNNLHSDHGDLIDEYNDLRSDYLSLRGEHSDLIDEYNDLVARYNELLN
jgi:hypothetical protein